jgi:hypothetical protein
MSVLIKPLITEKMSMLTEKRQQYGCADTSQGEQGCARILDRIYRE